MATATVDDIVAHLGRPLTTQESALAEACLEAADAALTKIYPSALATALTDPNYAFAALHTAVAIAAKLITLPDSYLRAQINDWRFLYGED